MSPYHPQCAVRDLGCVKSMPGAKKAEDHPCLSKDPAEGKDSSLQPQRKAGLMCNAANPDVNSVAKTHLPPSGLVVENTGCVDRFLSGRTWHLVLLVCQPTSHFIQRDMRKKPLGTWLNTHPRHWSTRTAGILPPGKAACGENMAPLP